MTDKLIVGLSSIKATYITSMGMDQTPVLAARVSTGKETTKFGEAEGKLINFLAKNKHFTPFEMIEVAYVIECPIYIARQFQRHRTFNYNEWSGRYSVVGQQFYVRDTFKKQDQKNKQGSVGDFTDKENKQIKGLMEYITVKQKEIYDRLIEMGVSREQSRIILGQNMFTKFWAKNDLRNWMHYCSLRIDDSAQEEHQYLAKQIFNDLFKMFPVTVAALAKSKFTEKGLKIVGLEVKDAKA